MADAVTNTAVYVGAESNRRIIHITNVSDGTGESDVVKVDISTLTKSGGYAGAPREVPTYTKIEKIEYNITGMAVVLEWDHTTDDVIAVLNTGQGEICFEDEGGKHDPRSTGGTGDILVTTVGHTSGDTYDIKIHVVLQT